MNLKLEDISHYLILIIFLLIILKVIGPGIQASILEFFTGKKTEEEFSLDDLIQQKKNQFTLMGAGQTEHKPILLRLNESENPNKEKLKKLLGSLQWGVPDNDFIPSTLTLLSSVEENQGMSQILSPIFEKETDIENPELLQKWSSIYDSIILWLNLVNSCKKESVESGIEAIHSYKSLLLFTDQNQEEIEKLTIEELAKEVEQKTQESSFLELNIISLKAEEIHDKWHKNALIFKSLQSKTPKS